MSGVLRHAMLAPGAFLLLTLVAASATAQLPPDVVLPGVTPTPAAEEEHEGDLFLDAPRLRSISIVVVDPGHGGDDAGARDPERGTAEKDLTLEIARRVEAKFAARAIGSGARVLLTRDGDVRTPIEDRTSLANESRADLFVSLHVNGSPSPEARGFHVAYHDASTADLGIAPGARGTRRSGPLPAQPWLTAQRRHEERSARFAEIMRESLAAKVTLPDRGVKRLPLAVLEGATCPAVAVELGYLTHPEEGLALSTDAVQDAVAEAIAEAVLRMDSVLTGSDGSPRDR